MASPSTQKADKRPISFVLEDGRTGETISVPLVIRPEDLTESRPALMTAVQTFNGAFIDNFGPGLTTIQISGHTGWRGGETEDGAAAFETLKSGVWSKWHAGQAAAVAAGQSPDVVKLIFVDALDKITAVVAPGAFVLKRNKSRPLLMMYQINMTVIDERIDAPLVDPLNLALDASPNAVVAGVKSLDASTSALGAARSRLKQFVGANFAAPLRDFMGVTDAAFGRVLAAVDGVRGVVGEQASQLVSVATDLAMVGRNAAFTYNAVANLADFSSNEVSEIASAYENAFCVLRNTFRRVREYPDYQGLYGASACSSTVGGSPLSAYLGQNPWETVMSGVRSSSLVAPDARANIEVFKAADPVLRPMSVSDMASRLATISSGVRFL